MIARAYRSWRAVLAVSALIGVAAVSSPAFADGTNAGTTVSNTFTLDYQVNSVSQAQITNDGVGGNAAPTVFTVDRIVDLSITAQGDLAGPPVGVTVTPGATGQSLVFGVVNLGNDNQAYALSVADVGADDFDVAGLTATIYADNGDGLFDPAVDTLIGGYTLGSGTPTADVAPDTRIFVVLTGDIPTTVTNGQTDGVILTANTLNPQTSLDPAYSLTPGAETVGTAGANNAVGEADTVLADGAGDTDAVAQGDFSATSEFVVATAALSATKTVSVIATDATAIDCANDPAVAGDQFAAPGACVEYVITVVNGPTAAATATDINVSDVLPAEVALVGATQNNFTTPGTLTFPLPCPDPCTVSLTGAELAVNTTATLIIRATVQ